MAMPFPELIVWLASLGFFYSLSSKHGFFELILSLAMIVFIANLIKYNMEVEIPTGWNSQTIITNTTTDTREDYVGSLSYSVVNVKWLLYFLLPVTIFVMFDIYGKLVVRKR